MTRAVLRDAASVLRHNFGEFAAVAAVFLVVAILAGISILVLAAVAWPLVGDGAGAVLILMPAAGLYLLIAFARALHHGSTAHLAARPTSARSMIAAGLFGPSLRLTPPLQDRHWLRMVQFHVLAAIPLQAAAFAATCLYLPLWPVAAAAALVPQVILGAAAAHHLRELA